MSFVFATPELVAAAAANLATIGSAVNAANAIAAAPTIQVLAAGADEVSAAIAALFGQQALGYHSLSAQAEAFHAQFAQALTASAVSYGGAEAASAAVLQGPGG